MEAFYPWIGTNYGQNGFNGNKLLIMGESSYCDSYNECEDCIQPDVISLCNYNTIHGIMKNMLGIESNKTYTIIYRLFVDEDKMTKQEFWNSICFYNYVQTNVGGKARIRPTEEMWKLSEKAYFETIKRINPDKIVFLGGDLWNHIPGRTGIEWKYGDILKNNNSEKQIWKYDFEGEIVSAIVVDHPSKPGFDYAELPFVREFVS